MFALAHSTAQSLSQSVNMSVKDLTGENTRGWSNLITVFSTENSPHLVYGCTSFRVFPCAQRCVKTHWCRAAAAVLCHLMLGKASLLFLCRIHFPRVDYKNQFNVCLCFLLLGFFFRLCGFLMIPVVINGPSLVPLEAPGLIIYKSPTDKHWFSLLCRPRNVNKA